MSYNYSHNNQYGQPTQYPSHIQPSQQYSAKHSSNPYLNAPYQQHQSSKVPETLLHPSPSPHKATLIRNQSFENRLYNEDLIQLIAKIRSLQDDLINQKFKNQALQRKAIDYQKIIDNLEYQMTEQAFQLQKYHHEIQLSNEKNLEILKYQQNLRIVGQEIQELNNVLIKKNKQFDAIGSKNKQLEGQIKKIEEDSNLLKAIQNMWKKQIDSICEEYQGFMEDFKEKTHRSLPNNHASKGAQQYLGQIPTSKAHFSNPKQQRLHQSQRQDSMTFNLAQSSEEMTRKFDQLRNIFASLTLELKQREAEFEAARKELSQNLIKQKEKVIKLEYEFKLMEERQRDTTKNQDLLSSYYNQQKAEEIIQQMMKKEDEYISRIQELSQENEALKEEITEMESNKEYFEKVDMEEKKSVIENLKKENELLEGAITELQQKLKALELNYETMMLEKYDEVQLEAENALKIAKKGRKIEEQNYEYKIKIEELAGQLSMLQKEITILKGQYPGAEQPHQQGGYQHQEKQYEK